MIGREAGAQGGVDGRPFESNSLRAAKGGANTVEGCGLVGWEEVNMVTRSGQWARGMKLDDYE